MSTPKLTYFDFSGSRGEECRIALFLAGIDFEDHRIAQSDWPDLKGRVPFSSLPVLDLGKGQLAESNAILVFIGRNHDFHPSDSFEAARHEAIMSATEAFRHALTLAQHGVAPEDKKASREKLAAGPLKQFAENMEAQLGEGPFLDGDKLCVADIKLYMIMRGFVMGIFDHIPTTVFEPYPKLTRLFNSVREHNKVSEWLAQQA